MGSAAAPKSGLSGRQTNAPNVGGVGAIMVLDWAQLCAQCQSAQI
jgi:hypothetical protein